MKKLLSILILLLLPVSVWAWGVVGMSGGVASAPGGTTCTGNYGETADGSQNSSGNGFTWVQRTAFGCTASSGDATFNLRVIEASNDMREFVFLVYADNAGEPGDLIWQSSPTYWSDNTSAMWKAIQVASALSGDYLWIGFHAESSNAYYHYTSNSPARTSRTITNSGTFPDVDSTWDVSNDATSDYGMAAYLSF